jgi:hypothetical protein
MLAADHPYTLGIAVGPNEISWARGVRGQDGVEVTASGESPYGSDSSLADVLASVRSANEAETGSVAVSVTILRDGDVDDSRAALLLDAMDRAGFPADSARMVWVGDAIAAAGRGTIPAAAAAAIEAWQDAPVDSATAPMDDTEIDDTEIDDTEIDDTEIDDTEIDDTDESVAAGPDIVDGSTRPAWVRPAVVGAVVAAVIVIVMFLLSPRAESGDGTPATALEPRIESTPM